jgi:hypothetical protein
MKPRAVLVVLLCAQVSGCGADLVAGSRPADPRGGRPSDERTRPDHAALYAATVRVLEARAALEPRRTASPARTAVADSVPLAEMLDVARAERRRPGRALTEAGPATAYATGGDEEQIPVFRRVVTDIFLPTRDIMVSTYLAFPAIVQHATTASVSVNGWELPVAQTTTTFPVPVLVYGSFVNLPGVDCTQAPASASATTQHSAGWNWGSLGPTLGTAQSYDVDECTPPCEPRFWEEQNPFSPAYDPYATDGGGSDDCADGGGGMDGGGEVFAPGALTGGQTVTWSTGAGTGEPSACGDNARVEYVCIDVWVQGVGWVEWGCGYVTTC